MHIYIYVYANIYIYICIYINVKHHQVHMENLGERSNSVQTNLVPLGLLRLEKVTNIHSSPKCSIMQNILPHKHLTPM